MLPKNACNFATMPVKHLKRILATMEPVTFSVHNMKALITRGARDVTRAELLKLLEFTTNIPPTGQVAFEHREFKVLDGEMQKLSSELVRRARGFTFPHRLERPGDP